MLKELKNLRKHYGITGQIWVFRTKRSKKEILAEWVICNALLTGELSRGQAVAEITAGNMGVALAEECKEIGSRLYLLPIGIFDERITDKLRRYPEVEIVEVSESRNYKALAGRLEEIVKEKNAYSFRQFTNPAQLDFYREILSAEPKLQTLRIDCVIDKVGTGATLRALEEVFTLNEQKPQKLLAASSPRSVDMTVFSFFQELPLQVWPENYKEYVENFESVLTKTEGLSDLNYAKLSIYCAVEWLKKNPEKNSFIFIGD